jgi:hypothetical protein
MADRGGRGRCALFAKLSDRLTGVSLPRLFLTFGLFTAAGWLVRGIWGTSKGSEQLADPGATVAPRSEECCAC